MVSRSVVAVLSGPWRIYGSGRAEDGAPSHINRVRFTNAARAAIHYRRDLVISLKESERDEYAAMAQEVLRELGRSSYPMHHAFAQHSLANAWSLLGFSAQHGITHMTVVTSVWHVERVRFLFGEMKTVFAQRGVAVPKMHFQSAPFVPHRETNGFERHFLHAQEGRKLEVERLRIAEYMRALTDGVSDLPPHPDHLTQFHFPRAGEGIVYSSQVDP